MPQCRRTRKYLQARKIQCLYLNVEADSSAMQDYNSLKGRDTRSPMWGTAEKIFTVPAPIRVESKFYAHGSALEKTCKASILSIIRKGILDK